MAVERGEEIGMKVETRGEKGFEGVEELSELIY